MVVAEGAGEELLGESTETDASGNKKLPQIGAYMKNAIGEYFSSKGEEATVKYVVCLFFALLLIRLPWLICALFFSRGKKDTLILLI